MLDYYRTLEITRNASADQIKAAYKKLAVKYHPDKNPGDPIAEKKFVEINEANEHLSDPVKRRTYDSKTNNAYSFNFYANMFSDGVERTKASDFTSDSIRKEAPPGESVVQHIHVTLHDVASGCFRDLTYMRNTQCRYCSGTGAKTLETCSVCDGRGHVIKVREGRKVGENCPHCNGSGVQTDEPCDECRGRGIIQENYTIRVDVPRGVMDGAEIDMIGKGHAGKNGGSYGKLIVKVNQLHDKVFTRDGFDMKCSAEVTYTDLVLGCKVKVPTLDGSVEIEIPPLTKPESVFRVKDKGLKNRTGDTVGNILVSLKLLVPDAITDDQKSLYGKIRESEIFF